MRTFSLGTPILLLFSQLLLTFSSQAKNFLLETVDKKNDSVAVAAAKSSKKAGSDYNMACGLLWWVPGCAEAVKNLPMALPVDGEILPRALPSDDKELALSLDEDEIKTRIKDKLCHGHSRHGAPCTT